MIKSALAHSADHPSIRLQPLPEVQALFGGISRANVYARIARGLLPCPVKIGKSITWPSNEVQALMRAHIRGASEADIADLVRTLHERRDGNGQSPVSDLLAGTVAIEKRLPHLSTAKSAA